MRRQEAIYLGSLTPAAINNPITNAAAKNGTVKAKKVSIPEHKASAVAKRKFPRPPVTVVEPALVIAVKVSIIPAVPPPAIAAIPHCNKGLTSHKLAAVNSVPIAIAVGISIVSKKLSTTGI